MPEYRYFLDEPFTLENTHWLSPDESAHFTVMRRCVGDRIEVVNGRGELAIACAHEISKKGVLISLKKIVKVPPSPLKIHLFQAIPKLNRLDTILEKGTELGMSAIHLFPGDLSEKKDFSNHQRERMMRILIAAIKQCGRLDLPEIQIHYPISQWDKKDLLQPAYFGDLKEDAPHIMQSLKSNEGTISFVVGPESGFSDREIQCLKKLGALGVRLHPNILRTDTAAIVALTAISLHVGIHQ